MKKPKKIIPKDFGHLLSILIDHCTKGKYYKELGNIVVEMADNNELSKAEINTLLNSKNGKVLPLVVDAINFGLMIGYAFSQGYPFEHSVITKELDYLSSQFPILTREKNKDLFFLRELFLERIVNAAEDKTFMITKNEVEKAATTIVLCWPQNQKPIKDFTERIWKYVSRDDDKGGINIVPDDPFSANQLQAKPNESLIS